MRKYLLALLLLCTTSAANETDAVQTLLDLFKRPPPELLRTEAAFECAALAGTFDGEEYSRLFRVGYKQGQIFFREALKLSFESEGVDLESLPWGEKMPFKDMREFIGFLLGQRYAKIEEKVTQAAFDEHYDRLGFRGAYKHEYDKRNCTLIGR